MKIKRQMLNKGMQGRIKICEIDKLNKESNNKYIDNDFEDIDILKKPKLRKIRTYGGWD